MRTHSAFLVSLLKDKKLERVAEIGVFKGSNAMALLQNLPIDLLIGIDPYVRYPEFDDNLSNKIGIMARGDLTKIKKQMLRSMKPFKERFQLVEEKSAEAAEQFDDETFDFVFIDGNHWYDYVVEDIKLWMPKVKKGGILAGHDYIKKSNCGVIQATTELLPDLFVNLKAKVWYIDKDVEKPEEVEPDEFEEPEDYGDEEGEMVDLLDEIENEKE